MLEDVRYRVLVISSNEKINDTIIKLLDKNQFMPPTFISSSFQSRRILLERNFDIVIINCPLGDDSETTLALDLKEKYNIAVLMLCSSYNIDEIYDKVHFSGVLCLTKPTSKMLFLETLQLIISSLHSYQKVKISPSSSLSQKMEEVKFISDIKFQLMKIKKMSEEEAHKYILNYAMNNRLSKIEAAKKILSDIKKGGIK